MTVAPPGTDPVIEPPEDPESPDDPLDPFEPETEPEPV